MIFGDMIGRWGRSYPDREALVDAITGRRYTYGSLAAEIDRLAGFLLNELEVRPGDRVACLSFNRAEYITLFYALGRLGAILVPLNFRLALEEFVYYLEDSAPKALFFDRDHQDTAAALKSRVAVEHWLCWDDDDALGPALPGILAQNSYPAPPEVEIQAETPHMIIYTSGTTGLPKGVILTHGMIAWNSFNTVLGWDLGPQDRTILHAAMFYTAGWNVFTVPIFHSRGVNVLVKSFEPDLILDLIQKEKITVFFGVPTMFQMMIDSPRFETTDFSRVRFLVSGGAPLGRDIFDTFKTRKNIHLSEGFGLTEIGPNNFMGDGKLGTVGHAMPHVDLKVIDENGAPAPVGREGELLLKGPHMCAGYWNKPEATAEAIRDGWFHTGDLVKLDRDGHLSIVGRKKDMIVSGGANVYPAEVERAVETHPAVAGAAVIGVPDPKWGEVGKCLVELKPGTSLTLEELNDFLGDRLGRFKRPKYLKVVGELPRTPASGKIQKFILKERHGRPDNE